MTERPILFSAPMVKAILAGEKTQTRRILKPQPAVWQAMVIDISKPMQNEDDEWGQVHTTWSWDSGIYQPEREDWLPLKGLRHRVGDRLWVREAWAYVGSNDPGWVLYRASGYEAECARHRLDRPYPDESTVRWRPSIHMPRALSRITLEVTAVQVERLQDISEEDAEAEGVVDGLHDFDCRNGYLPDPAGYCVNGCGQDGYVEVFRRLWTSINGPDSWEANPEVAVVSFRRITE